MNILISGSQTLSELDKRHVKRYLNTYASKHKIHVMCYNGLEKEVLKFFIKHSEWAKNLSIYSFQERHILEESLNEAIDMLVKNGANYKNYGYLTGVIVRKDYEKTMKSLIENNIDLVACLYNGDKTTALIPFDIAKPIKGVERMIYDLPGEDLSKAKTKIEDRIRVI